MFDSVYSLPPYLTIPVPTCICDVFGIIDIFGICDIFGVCDVFCICDVFVFLGKTLVQELRVPQRKALEHFDWHVESPHVKPLFVESLNVKSLNVKSLCKNERYIPGNRDLPFGPRFQVFAIISQ